jgi:hypothetical protein
VRQARGPEPAPLYPLNLYRRPSTYSLKRAVPTLRFSIRKPRFPQAGLSLL